MISSVFRLIEENHVQLLETFTAVVPVVCLLPLQHFFNGAAVCNLASQATT